MKPDLFFISDRLRQNLLRAPLIDGCLIVAQQLAEDLIVVGAEAIGQTERLFGHALK